MTVENLLRYAYVVSLALLVLLISGAIYMYYASLTNGKPQMIMYEFTTLDIPLGSFGTRALGVNDQGDIVGTNGDKAFVIRNGTSSAIHVDGSPYDAVSGINNSGVMAGMFSDTKQSKAFIYDGKTYTAIEPPAVSYTQPPRLGSSIAYGINKLGM